MKPFKPGLTEQPFESMRSPEEEAEDQKYWAHVDGYCFYLDACSYCDDIRRENERAMLKTVDWAMERILDSKK